MIIETFKKANRIEKVAIGLWKDLVEKLGLEDMKKWDILSSGAYEGNFLHLDIGDGKHAYAFLTDPFYGDYWLIMITKGKKDLIELRRIMPLFLEIFKDTKRKEYEGKKVCWECGKEFSFNEITLSKDEKLENASRQLERKIEMWKDSYCGCGG